MNIKQRQAEHQKMGRFLVDMENDSLKVTSLKLTDLQNQEGDTFRWLGIQLSSGENTFHMYWVLYWRASLDCCFFLSDCRLQTWNPCSGSTLHPCLCVCLRVVLCLPYFRQSAGMFVQALCAYGVCWRLNVHMCIRRVQGSCLRATCNREPFFQPCSHPAASKQQMAGPGATADLVRLCLLGSNCVLTWRETKYHGHAGKQITVTSLAGIWLYLSHVQMEFEEKKLAHDAAWLKFMCVHLTVCLPVCLSRLSTCPSTCLSPQQLPVCFLIYQPVCFLCWGRCFSAAGLYMRQCSRGTKINIYMWIRASECSP